MKTSNSKQLCPEEILDPDRFLDYEQTVTESDMIPIALGLLRENSRICDIGGASGVFLGELIRLSGVPIRASILEINDSYKARLVNKDINFIHGSILDGVIEGNSFDCVTFRHILHHLVADNIEDTQANQDMALDEIFRITKPGGYVIFEEEVNNIRLFSRIVYYLSKFANRFRVRCRLFEAGKVVVSFMTQKEIRRIIRHKTKKYGLQITERKFVRWRMPLRWKLTLLMSNVGHVLYVIRVNK